MVERLKQIWGGFEKETTRNLTGRGVENIQVPHHRNLRAEGEAQPATVEAPATAAFEALKSRLASQSKKGKRGEEDDEASYVAESEAARDLIRGLKATEARTTRTERLYDGSGVREKRSLFGGGKGVKEKKSFKLF